MGPPVYSHTPSSTSQTVTLTAEASLKSLQRNTPMSSELVGFSVVIIKPQQLLGPALVLQEIFMIHDYFS